jgi:hypothetical protein
VFPSPQGGSETQSNPPYPNSLKPVSIPSRRVGDSSQRIKLPSSFSSFHPLKAGRRLTTSLNTSFVTCSFPSPQGGSETTVPAHLYQHSPRFPSPQGGSETVVLLSGKLVGVTFHPLKAGRRLVVGGRFGRRAGGLSIPSRRVGDQGEMRGKAGKRRQKGGRVAVDLR